MDNRYQEIWDEIKKHNKITICTHIDPDGDTIGSAIALKYLILENANNKEVKISSDKYPIKLNFLEQSDAVNDIFFNDSLKIVVDTSNYKRIFDKRVITKESIKIDHHQDEEEWFLKISGDKWPATGEIIYELIHELKLKINKKINQAIFVAIWTDTNGLKERRLTSNTKKIINFLLDENQKTKSLLSITTEEKIMFQKLIDKNLKINKIVSYLVCELKEDFYRDFVSYFFEKTKTNVAMVCIKKKDYYRIGLRSREKIHVGEIAKKFNGGGHFTSAGIKIDINEDIDIIIKNIMFEIKRSYND